jgi:hypothetical protein
LLRLGSVPLALSEDRASEAMNEPDLDLLRWNPRFSHDARRPSARGCGQVGEGGFLSGADPSACAGIELWARPAVNGPGELGMSNLVLGDETHRARDADVCRSRGLMQGDQGSEGLADAPFDRVLERQRLERGSTWTRRGLGGGNPSAEAAREGGHDSRVTLLVVRRARGGTLQANRRSEKRQAGAELVESFDRRRLEVRRPDYEVRER